MKRYKKLNEKYVDEGSLSTFYFSDRYKDYEYGNPRDAAKNIWDETTKYLDEIEKNLKLAGEFLAPAMKQATLKTLMYNIKNLKTK